MGQVPQNPNASRAGDRVFGPAASSSPRYGIVGDGRMARHFTRYLSLKGIPFQQWSRRQEALDGDSVEARLEACDTILILLRDSAIEPFVAEHPRLQGKKLVHFSGALVTSRAQGFHPLMTFGPELYALETYEAMAFVCERGPLEFSQIFPELQNSHFEIAPPLKARYHALCVMAGNFTVLLWQKLFEDFGERLGIPAEAALPYLRRVARNIEENPKAALTGPLQRGDLATVQKNLASLEGDVFQEVYQSFVQACAPALARELKREAP